MSDEAEILMRLKAIQQELATFRRAMIMFKTSNDAGLYDAAAVLMWMPPPREDTNEDVDSHR